MISEAMADGLVGIGVAVIVGDVGGTTGAAGCTMIGAACVAIGNGCPGITGAATGASTGVNGDCVVPGGVMAGARILPAAIGAAGGVV